MIQPIDEFEHAAAPTLLANDPDGPVPMFVIAAVVCAAGFMIAHATRPSRNKSSGPYCRML